MSAWHLPYWERIKQHNRIELTSDYAEHSYILKAIRKLAGQDVGFKFICAEENKKYRICSIRSPHKLVIYLEWKSL